MIAPPKSVEDVRQVLGRDPWAGVPNDNLSMALALARAKRHAPPLGRELESVSEEIANDLEQAVAIRAH